MPHEAGDIEHIESNIICLNEKQNNLESYSKFQLMSLFYSLCNNTNLSIMSDQVDIYSSSENKRWGSELASILGKWEIVQLRNLMNDMKIDNRTIEFNSSVYRSKQWIWKIYCRK